VGVHNQNVAGGETDFTELAAPIGTPDVELNLIMTNEGLQFEWVNTADGQRRRWTSTWAEVFGK